MTALKATDNAADVNSLASAEVLLGTTAELSRTGVNFGTVVRPVAGVLAAALLFSGCGGGDSPYGGGGAPSVRRQPFTPRRRPADRRPSFPFFGLPRLGIRSPCESRASRSCLRGKDRLQRAVEQIHPRAGRGVDIDLQPKGPVER